jgi:hypothetical protein
LNYAPFGSLPPLYGTGTGASFVEPGPPIADGAPLGPQATAGIDITRQLQKQPSIDAQIVRKQIFYYFNRVRKMQYWFAGDSTKDVLRDIVVSTAFSPTLCGAVFWFAEDRVTGWHSMPFSSIRHLILNLIPRI